MALPIVPVTIPAVLAGQSNGRLPSSILHDTPGQAGGRRCAMPGCLKPHKAKGFCRQHYRRLRVFGDPTDRRPELHMTALERFEAKVERQSGGCWLWTAAKIPRGYGHFGDQGRLILAHRWAYEHFVGPIPDGLELDHLCRVRHCVNPDHLEPVTQRENALRGYGVGALNARKTECIRGHPFTEENTYRRPGMTIRVCRTCKAAYQRAYQRQS